MMKPERGEDLDVAAASADFRRGVRRIVRGAAALAGGAVMLLVSYHRTGGGVQDLIGAAILLWGGLEAGRGYLQARRAAVGPLAGSFRRIRSTLVIGLLVFASLAYWSWYLGRYRRARLIARWEMNSRTLGTFDDIEARMFRRLDRSGTDAEWLETWREFAPELAAFESSIRDALRTGERLEGLLRRDTRRRELRASLEVVRLYLQEVEIYGEIEALFAAGEPGAWPQGLRDRIDALYMILQRIQGFQRPEPGAVTGGGAVAADGTPGGMDDPGPAAGPVARMATQ